MLTASRREAIATWGGGMVVDRKLDEDTRTAEHSLLVTGTESKGDYE